jgi:hypothetical protein
MPVHSESVVRFTCQNICRKPCDEAIELAQLIIDTFAAEDVYLIRKVLVDLTNALVCPFECGSEEAPMGHA